MSVAIRDTQRTKKRTDKEESRTEGRGKGEKGGERGRGNDQIGRMPQGDHAGFVCRRGLQDFVKRRCKFDF